MPRISICGLYTLVFVGGKGQSSKQGASAFLLESSRSFEGHKSRKRFLQTGELALQTKLNWQFPTGVHPELLRLSGNVRTCPPECCSGREV